MSLSDYLISQSGNQWGTEKKPWGEKVYAIPHAAVESVRSGFMPQNVKAGGAKTIAGGIGAYTLTVTGGAFFTNTATDAGKAVTVWGVGTYTVATVTSTTVAVVTTAFASTFSLKTFVMTGNAIWSGDTGVYARRLAEFTERKEFPGRPGFAEIRARYGVPTMRTLLLEDTTKAHIRVVSGGQPSKRLVETTGSYRTIEGEDPTLATILTHKRPITYKRVGGAPNVAYDNTPHLILTFAAPSISLATNFGYVGKKNSDTLTNLGGALAGTMLCIALECEKDWDTGALWMCNMHLLYRSAGWTCISRAYVEAVLTVFGLDIADNGTVTNAQPERIVQTITATKANNNAGFADVTDLDVSDGAVAFAAFNTLTEWEATA